MSDATGSVSIPAGTSPTVRNSSKEIRSECRCSYPDPSGPMGLSRDTWAKVFLWLLPIVFSAGVLFYGYQGTREQVKKNEESLVKFGETQQVIYTDQQVQANTLSAIKAEQAEMKVKVDGVDGKLDDQKSDLVLIKARLRIRQDASGD